MTKKNPLRRLSVVWRLKEAYEPSPTSPAVDTPTISKFLSISKTNFLKDAKEDPAKCAQDWTVVMGNEAGDLDSVASSIAYAWILSEIQKSPAVALIQLERADLTLRAENLHAFKLAGLTSTLDELLTLTELSQFQPQKFALVDHNRLSPQFNHPEAQVLSLFDHHQDENLYPSASPRIISPTTGSCSSLITSHFPPSSNPLPDLALLLLTAILIDTDGLKPNGKASQTDRDSALFLATKSTIANSIPPLSALSPIDHPNPNQDALYDAQAIKDLTKVLREKKGEVDHLSPFDLLRRDYKEYTYTLSWANATANTTGTGNENNADAPTIKLGLSTVVSSLKSWGTNGALEHASTRWMTQRGLSVLGICTTFHDVKKLKMTMTRTKKSSSSSSSSSSKDKGKHKREQAWFVLPPPPGGQISAEQLAKHLWTGLEAPGAATTALQLERYKRFAYLEKASSTRLPEGSHAKAYKQKNVETSRKGIAPLVKSILESPSPVVVVVLDEQAGARKT